MTKDSITGLIIVGTMVFSTALGVLQGPANGALVFGTICLVLGVGGMLWKGLQG